MLVSGGELKNRWRVYSLMQKAKKRKNDLKDSSERTGFQILVGSEIYL